jgi:phosphoribosylanthranilate isomerase
VKICGITRAKDAQTSIHAGADALGLVFYAPSPRAVTLSQAQEIAALVPPFVTVTALFVNPSVEEVQKVLDGVRIDLLQFHGDEDEPFCAQFHKPYIKAIRVRQTQDVVAASLRFPSALALLLDSFKPGVPGGTGETFDWSLIPEVTHPLILAGGLTAKNVATAIAQVHPFAVDVSGGVEHSKGIKSASKINDFMNEVSRG